MAPALWGTPEDLQRLFTEADILNVRHSVARRYVVRGRVPRPFKGFC